MSDSCRTLTLCVTDANEEKYGQDYYTADMVQASFARSLERENAKMARWIIQHCDHWRGDHACAECFPGGENIVEGFRCAVHVANSALARPTP